MPKINENINKFRGLYLAGFCIILFLPILGFSNFFFPPDFAKSIIFRSVVAILLFIIVAHGVIPAKAGIQNKSTESGFRVPTSPTASTGRGKPGMTNPIVWALGSLFAIFALATIFSVDVNFSLFGSPYRGGGFITFAFCFAFSLLAFVLLKRDDWKKAWIFSIGIGILVSLVAIIQYLGLFSKIFLASGEPSSTLGNPILLAIYLLLLFFPTLAFAIKEQNKNLKIFYIASLVLFLYTIFISGTRAAYLGIIVGVLYFLLAYPQKFKKLKIAAAGFLVLIILIVAYVNIFPNSPQIFQKVSLFYKLEHKLSIKSAMADERFKAWQTVILEIKNKPTFYYPHIPCCLRKNVKEH